MANQLLDARMKSTGGFTDEISHPVEEEEEDDDDGSLLAKPMPP